MEIRYNNWTLDSEEELFFVYWLEELKSHGYVVDFERVESPIKIFDKVHFKFHVEQKNKIKELDKFMLHDLTYTPDFRIHWSEITDGNLIAIKNHTYKEEDFKRCIFYCDEDLVSLVDVKGAFATSKQISAITFPVIQKILANRGIYVQKIIPFTDKGLFAKTFTPIAYQFTKTGKLRKINWAVIDVKNFLKNANQFG